MYHSISCIFLAVACILLSMNQLRYHKILLRTVRKVNQLDELCAKILREEEIRWRQEN